MSNLILHTRLLFMANLRTTLRSPVWVIMGLFQPICYLLLFAPLLDRLPLAAGGSSAFNVFTPGLLTIMGIYGGAFAGFGLIGAMREGVIERLRVTPVNRLALILGMVLRDAFILLVQCILLIAIATIFGLRADPVGLVLTFALLMMIGVMTSALSYGLALTLKDENALASTVNFFTLPLLLLSGVMLPLTLAPRLMQQIAEFNPFSHAVKASRALMNSQFSDTSIVLAFVVFVALTALALRWAIGAMRQATA